MINTRKIDLTFELNFESRSSFSKCELNVDAKRIVISRKVAHQHANVILIKIWHRFGTAKGLRRMEKVATCVKHATTCSLTGRIATHLGLEVAHALTRAKIGVTVTEVTLVAVHTCPGIYPI